MPNSEASTETSKWYATERNTESLIKGVIAARGSRSLSGDDIWYLLQLTWINASRGHTIADHWKNLKVPALAHLLNKSARIAPDLDSSIAAMRLPAPVARAALKETGFVNAYRVYRNSLRKWCSANVKELRAILRAAEKLGPNDQARFDLAIKIDGLPSIPSPSRERSMVAANMITPLVACIDPLYKFPILNGEEGVTRRLTKLGLINRDLRDRLAGFIGLIGQFGLSDAFAVDTMTDEQIDKIRKQAVNAPRVPVQGVNEAPLPPFDDAERQAVQKSQTITYRRRHNRMTTRLKELFPGLQLTQGTSANARYDVLIKDYDSRDRDLLIEVKPDPDKGSIRIGIGQLLDYRRFLPQRAGTDLAILTISRPPDGYISFLQDLQITSLWFADEDCSVLTGEGKVWKSFQMQIHILNKGKSS